MEWTELGSWGKWIDFPEAKWEALSNKVETAYQVSEVFPPRENLFAALNKTPPAQVRAVILGQDPYHEPGQAHGLCFSVQRGTKIPKSLQNIYKEMETDLGAEIPSHGCLESWTEQGVLLLNAILTVEAHKAASHRSFGWEAFTDQVIRATNALPQPIAFVLWGSFAGKKAELIDAQGPRLVLTGPHPSPLSAYRGFFGSRPFSQVNDFLRENGEKEIRWEITG